MGNGSAVRGLLDVHKREDPDVLFLCETKMRREKLEGLRWKLGMPNMMVKNSEGQSGGLAIFLEEYGSSSCVTFHVKVSY
jgi:exonuclease III